MEKTITNAENGKANKLDPEDRAFHDWYRFVLSFPPHLVRDYLKQFDIQADHWVLDPFCGTGTTIVECKKNGIPSIGVEANPVVQYLASTKVNWKVDANSLEAHGERIAEAARQIFSSEGIDDEPGIGFFEKKPNLDSLHSLSEEAQKLLIKDSISPLPLHKTLILLESIENNRNEDFYDFERTALAKQVVYNIGNLRFGPEVGVGKIKSDNAVIRPWLESIRSMAADLRTKVARENIATPASVILSDSRKMVLPADHVKISGVITSPPYPNEKDYSRTTRLEAVLLGFVENKKHLRDQKQTFVRSNTRGIYVADEDDLWIRNNSRVMELAEEIEKTRIRMGKDSGFEKLYHVVVKQYFGGMARHLHELKTYLKPGAHLAYVVGDQASYLRIMIRTGEILSSIGRDLGYTPVGIDLFRTRFSTATKEDLREEVVLFRWDP